MSTLTGKLPHQARKEEECKTAREALLLGAVDLKEIVPCTCPNSVDRHLQGVSSHDPVGGDGDEKLTTLSDG
ncbi:hypothetical protein RUM43_003538 [Polyplax serrata]|uniref:Uncharacterized protein n=1 Tax=Polyplax serrata TaxID=468196 RepID=A0AAN8S392_POLSC